MNAIFVGWRLRESRARPSPDLATPSDSATAGYSALKKSGKCENYGLAAGCISCKSYARSCDPVGQCSGGLLCPKEIGKM
jgi:hypothetical protein